MNARRVQQRRALLTEPPRACVKAMARRAKTSHFGGAFQVLHAGARAPVMSRAATARRTRRGRGLLDRLSSHYEK